MPLYSFISVLPKFLVRTTCVLSQECWYFLNFTSADTFLHFYWSKYFKMSTKVIYLEQTSTFTVKGVKHIVSGGKYIDFQFALFLSENKSQTLFLMILCFFSRQTFLFLFFWFSAISLWCDKNMSSNLLCLRVIRIWDLCVTILLWIPCLSVYLGNLTIWIPVVSMPSGF